MIKYPKGTKLMLMPNRIYRVNEGILIKRVVVGNDSYCNLNVFLAGSYFKSDNREYLAVTPLNLEEVLISDVPPEELSRQVARLEELVELLSVPKKDPTISIPDTRMVKFVRWWRHWVGNDPTQDISQEQIGAFTGCHRVTVNKTMSKLVVSGALDDIDY